MPNQSPISRGIESLNGAIRKNVRTRIPIGPNTLVLRRGLDAVQPHDKWQERHILARRIELHTIQMHLSPSTLAAFVFETRY